MMFGEKTRQAPAGYASMKKLLAPLRLYDLDGDSLVSRELKSYAAGLDLFRERVAAVWRDLYPDLCSAEELARWERRLDLPVERAEEEDRRAMAMQRLSICDGDFTREGIERSLASAGLLGQIAEDFSQRRVLITDGVINGGYASLDEVKRQALAMLPAHLEADFAIGVLTW